MEQALGHVTHYRNLRTVADRQPDITPVWLPIPFDVRGPARLVPVLSNTWSVRASWRARRALDAVRQRVSLDAIVFHTQVTSLFSVGMMRDMPTVISLDATPINYDTIGRPYGHRPAGHGLLDRKKYELNRRAFHAAAKLVAWSEWARRSLIQDYGVDPTRIHVLAPGAASPYFEIGEARLAEPRSQDPARPVRILFVGGDFYRKGGPLLLDCLRGPLGRRCELHLVTQCHVQPQPNVFVYSGLKANSQPLLRLFAEADLFVLPTQADSFGLVLMEAAAAGLPAVATNVGGLPEAVRDGESGVLVQVGDQPGLEAALTALVEDPVRRLRMGRAGHAMARQKFDANCNNRRLLDLVRELVEARPIPSEAA
ncbi:MAG: glycosyltransferase family 4 protein [Chloroflexi bacterium]|nr:glycosyltransferase family 4 protein [Chloroflexota bacterium]